MSRGEATPTIDERSPLIRAASARSNDDMEDQALPDQAQMQVPGQTGVPRVSHDESRPTEHLLADDRPSEAIDLEDPMAGSKSPWYLALLTISIGGLQIVWSVELSNGSPYLLSLGMSKALVAFVWLAGPLTGVLVQPYIGIKSDRCRVSWGKRKPFMVAGTLGTVASSMILAYARDIIRVLGGLAVDAPYHGAYRTAVIVLATIMMWCLDFSINTVQAAIRAFIVDGAPSHQQESANAWASRMTGVGNVLGYIFGYLNLPQYFHFLGNTQFKGLVVIASIALSSTILVSILAIKERNPQLDPPSKSDYDSGLLAFFKQTYVSLTRLPPTIRKVCEIQFFHWVGWFPFLFYITTYIGQLYVNPYLRPGLSDDEVDALWSKATRVGTLALLIYAITSFASNICLPFLIVPTYKAPPAGGHGHLDRSVTPTSPIGYGRPPIHTHPVPTRETAGWISRCLVSIQIPGLTLRRAWLLSQLLFSACTFSTFFISTTLAATVMTALVGISWSLTIWAPFALISAEISRRDEARRRRHRQRLMTGDIETADGDADKYTDDEDQAGIILGLHNVAVSAPQILATLICSVVFSLLQKPRNEPGDVSVGWNLRIGGLATLIAAYITWRMEEPDNAGGGDK